MNKVSVNVEKCIGCGLCAKDCVGADISIVEKKAVPNGKTCILCGHCESICPNNAIVVNGFEDKIEEFEEQTRLNPEELLKAIKTRRTIRQFKADEVPEDVVNMIIEAGRQAPTGTNAQGTSYIILNKKKDECEAVAVKMFRKLLRIGKLVVPMLKNMSIDENYFFKKAPLVIVVLGKDKVSASLAAQNMAFMAEANGLGVLFSGFFTSCLKLSSRIKKIIGLKGKIYPVITLVIGYPAVKYHRTAHRKSVSVIEA